jgi:hypothetical protein
MRKLCLRGVTQYSVLGSQLAEQFRFGRRPTRARRVQYFTYCIGRRSPFRLLGRFSTAIPRRPLGA